MIPFPPHPCPRHPLRMESKLFFKSLSSAFCLALWHPHFIPCHLLLSLGSYFTELLIVALTHHASPHLHVALCASNPTASAAAVTLAPCTVALSHSVLIVCLHFSSPLDCKLHKEGTILSFFLFPYEPRTEFRSWQLIDSEYIGWIICMASWKSSFTKGHAVVSGKELELLSLIPNII